MPQSKDWMEFEIADSDSYKTIMIDRKIITAVFGSSKISEKHVMFVVGSDLRNSVEVIVPKGMKKQDVIDWITDDDEDDEEHEKWEPQPWEGN